MPRVLHIGSGDRESIMRRDVVGGEITLTGLDLSEYADVRLYMDGITVDTDDAAVYMQLEIAGSVISTGYRHTIQHRSMNGGTSDSDSAATTVIPFARQGVTSWGLGNAAGECLSGVVRVHNFNQAVNKLLTLHTARTGPTGATIHSIGHAQLENTGLITGFRLYCPDGGAALASGNVFLVGIPIP